jgi:hypothetical protein
VLSPRFVPAGVLEGVHHGFFESYPFKMRLLKAALQYFEDLDGEIFRGGHFLGEFLQGIQILQIVAGEHFPFDEAVEIDEVADHAGGGIDGAADGDFEGVVVTVSVRVVAFAVSGDVFFGGHVGAMQAVRGREAIAAGEVSFHLVCLSVQASLRDAVIFSVRLPASELAGYCQRSLRDRLER